MAQHHRADHPSLEVWKWAFAPGGQRLIDRHKTYCSHDEGESDDEVVGGSIGWPVDRECRATKGETKQSRERQSLAEPRVAQPGGAHPEHDHERGNGAGHRFHLYVSTTTTARPPKSNSRDYSIGGRGCARGASFL